LAPFGLEDFDKVDVCVDDDNDVVEAKEKGLGSAFGGAPNENDGGAVVVPDFNWTEANGLLDDADGG
jgi:hypothetical protein